MPSRDRLYRVRTVRMNRREVLQLAVLAVPAEPAYKAVGGFYAAASLLQQPQKSRYRMASFFSGDAALIPPRR